MTDPTPQPMPQPLEPLYDDKRIRYVMDYDAVSRYPNAEWLIQLLLTNMRDAYEQERQQLHARIATLERQADADGWTIADLERRYNEAMEQVAELEAEKVKPELRTALDAVLDGEPTFGEIRAIRAWLASLEPTQGAE